MDRPPLEVADLVRAAGQAFIERSRKWISWKHIKVLLAIVRCRTAVLGGHLDECTRCDIASSLSIPVEIATARSVRWALANAGWKSVAASFFRRPTCM
jgi:hypothetical protein